MLVSFCLTGLALGKDDGDGEEDAAKAKPALPNFYLDMRTIYSTLPAGSLSIGFSTPPLLSTLANLSSLRTPTSPSSRSISVDLPLTVDVNDQLSVYGGVSGATSQAGYRSLDGLSRSSALRSDSRPTSISRTAECFRPSPFNPTCRGRFQTRRWPRRPTTRSSKRATHWMRMRREGCSRECSTPGPRR